MKGCFALRAATAGLAWVLVSQGALASDGSAEPQSASGERIALHGTAKGVPACVNCHGAHGEGQASAGFPRLAGLSDAYLTAQLAAFADASRQSDVMQPFASMMSPGERAAVAQYFSSLSPPADIRERDSADLAASDLGAWLATRGRWQEGLPACVQCHGPGGAGVGSAFPPLGGQPASYIASQLHAWKDGKRPPGPMSLMSTVASKLSDADIDAVAAYYGQQSSTSNASK